MTVSQQGSGCLVGDMEGMCCAYFAEGVLNGEVTYFVSVVSAKEFG